LVESSDGQRAQRKKKSDRSNNQNSAEKQENSLELVKTAGQMGTESVSLPDSPSGGKRGQRMGTDCGGKRTGGLKKRLCRQKGQMGGAYDSGIKKAEWVGDVQSFRTGKKKEHIRH